MEILKYPDPFLKHKCKPLKTIDEQTVARVADMFETMYQARGVGLAAPQVGWDARLFIVNVTANKRDELVFVNPVIVEAVGTVNEEEGCLSVPGLQGEVPRAERVTITGIDENRQKVKIKAEGLLARIFQHELDHLNGTLFVDRLSFTQRALIAGKLHKLRRNTAHHITPEASKKHKAPLI